MTPELAAEVVREWLGPSARLARLGAMNSDAFDVSAQGKRYVLKVASVGNAPGLAAASWLEERGFRTGAPIRTAIRGGELVALLRFADGRPLEMDQVEAIGRTLGTVHTLLRDAPVPTDMVRWPWAWLAIEAITERELRDAAGLAVQRAAALAGSVSHGILHGDPAPEAFLDRDGDVALIDWGSALHGPLLYDVASAWMYTARDPRLPQAYAATAPIGSTELTLLPEFLALRWAVQAWYFSWRIATNDLTGIDGPADNEEGLAHARTFLLHRE